MIEGWLVKSSKSLSNQLIPFLIVAFIAYVAFFWKSKT